VAGGPPSAAIICGRRCRPAAALQVIGDLGKAIPTLAVFASSARRVSSPLFKSSQRLGSTFSADQLLYLALIRRKGGDHLLALIAHPMPSDRDPSMIAARRSQADYDIARPDWQPPVLGVHDITNGRHRPRRIGFDRSADLQVVA
jgi:hypothetical protein